MQDLKWPHLWFQDVGEVQQILDLGTHVTSGQHMPNLHAARIHYLHRTARA